MTVESWAPATAQPPGGFAPDFGAGEEVLDTAAALASPQETLTRATEKPAQVTLMLFWY